ncbi:hypothetical protein BP6252_03973 [Coleophoma cylindrospora]|uniref:AB hydrolase-1 domain-containing protein n=1 Tax=Coleophoma cylindrospora TaxID=1849047 RepID=A0A3D8S9Q1_9HELO|nr:hypothetical protein BP6252_03973 [Coleophoma cylindrospora]
MATQQTARTEFLTVNDINYAYRLIGPEATSGPAKSPLLLLNHIRSTIDLWDPAVVNPLARTRQLVLYDYAGTGHSSGKVADSIKEMTENLIGFLKSLFPILGVSTVDVLGFSIGGYVAQQLVIDCPQYVGRLVLSGTQPSFGPDLVSQAVEFPQIASTPVPTPEILYSCFNVQTPSSQAAASAWVQRIYERSTNAPEGETFANFLSGELHVENLMKAFLGWNGDASPYTLLPTIKNEVLVTTGRNDAMCPTSNSYILSQRLTNAYFLVYPDSGHGHLFQFANLYTKQVTEFLDGGWNINF